MKYIKKLKSFTESKMYIKKFENMDNDLITAIRNENIKFVKQLIQSGCDISETLSRSLYKNISKNYF